MACPPEGNDPDGVASGGTNYRHVMPSKSLYGQKSLFPTSVNRRRLYMRRLENYGNIEKIETVLFKVRKPFSFIPFKAH
jgi:hypothetical protein